MPQESQNQIVAEGQAYHSSDRAAQVPESKQWWTQRGRIKQLYLVDGLTREQTRLIMKYRYGFDATDVQYKYQIKKWQFQKTLTIEEKKYVILKTLQRQQNGKATRFLLCGCDLQDGKLSRQRKTIIANDTGTQELGPIPRNITFYTPPSTPPSPTLAFASSSSSSESRDTRSYRPLCITCAKCEIDIYGSSATILADFDEHLQQEHSISLPMTCVLTASTHEPVELIDWMQYDTLFKSDFWQKEHTYKDLKFLAIIQSLNSTSLVQQTPTKSMWLTDRVQWDTLTTMGLLTRSPDKTPEMLLDSILAKIPLASDEEGGSTSADPDTHDERQHFHYDMDDALTTTEESVGITTDPQLMHSTEDISGNHMNRQFIQAIKDTRECAAHLAAYLAYAAKNSPNVPDDFLTYCREHLDPLDFGKVQATLINQVREEESLM